MLAPEGCKQLTTHAGHAPVVHTWTLSVWYRMGGRGVYMYVYKYTNLVQCSSAANVSVPHTDTTLIVTGHQVVFVVRVVCNATEGNRNTSE